MRLIRPGRAAILTKEGNAACFDAIRYLKSIKLQKDMKMNEDGTPKAIERGDKVTLDIANLRYCIGKVKWIGEINVENEELPWYGLEMEDKTPDGIKWAKDGKVLKSIDLPKFECAEGHMYFARPNEIKPKLKLAPLRWDEGVAAAAKDHVLDVGNVEASEEND